MTSQSAKHTTGLAGEFLVAGELLRRGIMAMVTYGNAKKADVVAVNQAKAISIEVKSTSKSKWVLGGSLPDDNQDIWVLVYLPIDSDCSPEYFVFTSAELRGILLPDHIEYNRKYLEKHGKEYSGNGVVSIKRDVINERSHRMAWHKVMNSIGF